MQICVPPSLLPVSNKHHFLFVYGHNSLYFPFQKRKIMVSTLHVVQREAPVVGLERQIRMIVPNRGKVSDQARLYQQERAVRTFCIFSTKSTGRTEFPHVRP